MKVSAKSNFENPPTGTHIARCIGLIGIGTHKTQFNGEDRFQDEIIIMWELPHELRGDQKPHAVQQKYTRSLGQKANLRKSLVAWRGRDFTKDELNDFELKNVLDKGCQVVLTENDKGYVNVTGVAGLPKGTQLPDRVHDLIYFDVVEFEEDAFAALPTYLQDKVTSSFEYKEQRDFGRILTEIERRKVDREGPAAIGKQEFSGPATAAATAPDPDDDIPF